MADKENIGRILQTEMNPSQDVAIPSDLALAKADLMKQYEDALGGKYKQAGPERVAQIAQVSQELDSVLIERMQKGIDNKDADPSAYKETDGKKEEGIKGIFNMLMNGLLGGLGLMGNIIGGVLQFFGLDTLAAKFFSDKSSDLTPPQKAKEKLAAGMVSGLEGTFMVGGMKMSISPERKKAIFEHLREADLDTPVAAPLPPQVREAASAIPNNTDGTVLDVPDRESAQLQQPPARGALVMNGERTVGK